MRRSIDERSISESTIRSKKICDKCSKATIDLQICSRCKRALCQKCSQQNNAQIKTCKACIEECGFITKQINQFKLKWCQQSSIGEQWAQSLLDKEFSMLKEEYQQIITSILKNKDSIRKQITAFDKAYIDIEALSFKGSGLNYSFQDFIAKVGFQNFEDQLEPVKNILYAFTYTRPEIGYQSQMKQLVFFLLCFMEESIAYFCFTKLFTEIMPEKIWPNSCNNEILKKRIKEISSVTLKFNCVSTSESIRNKYEDFLQKNILQFYSCFMIGIVSYKESFTYFANLVKEKRFYCVDEFVMIISLINYDAIVNEKLYLHEQILYQTNQLKISNFKIQLNEFLENVSSTNQIYTLYKQNEKLLIQKEQLVEILCQLQAEEVIKQNQQNYLESEIDMTKFVTEIGTHTEMQEEARQQLMVSNLRNQYKELEQEEQKIKESIQSGEEEIHQLMDKLHQFETTTRSRNEKREAMETKYLNKQNQLNEKIKNLEKDLQQYDLDIASTVKIIEARKKILLNPEKQQIKKSVA